MRECVSKLLKEINWEYVVIALGFILLGYVIGIIGFGAEFDLSDWITSISSIVVAIVAIQGLSAYKKQYHYSTAKIAAESLLRNDWALNTLRLRGLVREFTRQLIFILHIESKEFNEIIRNRIIEMKNIRENILDVSGGILTQEYEVLKLKKKNLDLYNDINKVIESIKDLNNTIEIRFDALDMIKDSDEQQFINIIDDYNSEYGAVSGDLYTEIYKKLNLTYPFSDDSAKKLFEIKNKLTVVLSD